MPELWDLSQPVIPSRSILYHLGLIGINTPYVESLTGYVIRLAEAHSVHPGVLMEREIAPLLDRQYAGANIHKMYNRISALNGTGAMASNLARALGSLTAHSKLYLLTMLPWTGALPPRALLRSVRAWCPKCYEEQRVNSKISEPLLWALNIVQICPIHQQRLCSICPHCQCSNLPLSWRARSGHCFRCEKWLGSLSSISSSECDDIPETELEWLVWAANAVGELIAVAPSLSVRISGEKVANNLITCVKLITDGNLAEFARLVQTPKNTVWLWCNGRNTPQLDALARLCFRLRISIFDLLAQEQIRITEETTRLLPKNCLQAKRRADIKFIGIDRVELQLKEVLLNHKLPPPSLTATARALGHHKETLYENFKDLCCAISAKYVQYRKLSHLSSIEKCCKEVQQIVLQLHEQGIYPSEAHVSQFLTKPGHLRYKKVRAVLQETREFLGLKE